MPHPSPLTPQPSPVPRPSPLPPLPLPVPHPSVEILIRSLQVAKDLVWQAFKGNGDWKAQLQLIRDKNKDKVGIGSTALFASELSR